MGRAARITRYLLIGLLAGLALMAGVLFLLTRTEFGIERVRLFATGWLADRIEGELRIGRVTSGGLLAGAMLHDVAIDDPRGRPFLRADSARLAYNWRTLAGGRIVFGGLTLYRPQLSIEKLPGDTAWNYEYIFPDTTPKEEGLAGNRLILIQRARVIDGQLVVRFPFQPAAPIQPDDTARLLLEPAAGGVVRVLRFERLHARVPRVLWESPLEEGQLFRFTSLSGRGYLYQDPFEVRDARGAVTVRDSLVSFDLARVQSGDTRAQIVGRVILGEKRWRYDIRIDSDRLRSRDLHWLHPRLPDNAAGRLVFRIQSQEPAGTLWLVSDAQLRAPGTRIAGSFGIITGDTLYFTRVNLRASPLNLQFLKQVLPGELPVDGLLVGTVEVEGPVSSLTTQGELRLASRKPAPSLSALSWSGTVDLRPPFAVQGLRAELRKLDLALFAALRPELRLGGSITGRIEATGRLDQSLRFAAALQHQRAGAPASQLEGRGALQWGADRTVDARFDARPLALDALAAIFPQLGRVTGELHGPVTIQGPLHDLAVKAEVATPGGPVVLEARLDLARPEPHYRAAGSVTDFLLDRVAKGLPATTITGRFFLEGAGTEASRARGVLKASLERGRVRDLDVSDGVLALTIAEGAARVDTFALESDAGRLFARGQLGLVAERRGELDLELDADSLGALRSFFFADTAGLPLEGEAARLAGALRLRARLEGGLAGFDVHAQASLQHLVYDRIRARRATFQLGATAVRSDSLRLRLSLRSDSLALYDRPLLAARLEAQYGDSAGQLEIEADAPDQQAYRLATDFHRAGGRAEFRLRELGLRTGPASWELAHPATVQAGPAGIAVMGLELVRATDRLEAGGSGRVRVSGSLPWEAALARSRTDLEPRGGAGGSMPPAAAPVRRQRDVDFRVDLEQVPIAEFLHVARPAAAADGMLAGHITVRGTPAAPTLEGKLAITDLRYGDIALGRVEGSMGYRERRLEAQLELREGSSPVLSGRGTIPLDLSLAPVPDRRLAEPLDFVIQADALPAALPAAFLSAFRDVKGSVAGRLTIGGTTREPVLGGALELRQGAALWQPTGVAYRNVEGSFRVVGPRQVAVDLELRTDETSSAAGEAGRWSGRGGRASLEGAVTFRPLSDPELDLVLRGSQFLAARRRDVELAASGELHLQGSYRRPRVRTALRIDRGALYLDELWRQYQIVELDSPLLFDVVDTSAVAFRKILPASSSPFLKNLVASGSLDVGRDFWLRSREMNVEVTGELTVAYDRRAEDRQPEDLRLWGTLSAVRGIYQVYGRRFEVRQGTVDFDGTPGIDPSLDITAGYRARTVQDQPLDIRAVVTGTLRSPRVALTSDAEPPISESDLASYLVFGRPTYLLAASESRALDLAGIGVFRAVAPSFLGYAASGLETFAQGFGLDYVAITAAETNLGEPQQGSAVSGLLGGAQVELGRYLGQNLFLAFTQRIGNAQRYSEPGVRLEWRFHPTWTAAAFAEDRFARNPAFGLEQGLELRKVYGFFLFRDWGY